MPAPSYDPNFPPNLNIAPLLPTAFEAGPSNSAPTDEWDQTVGIERYGIAGRVWDASYPLLPYVTRPSPSSPLEFEPESSLFQTDTLTLLELGSGQSLASLHLASQLSESCQITLTDLPEVVALCEKNANEKLANVPVHAIVNVQGLAWGDEESVGTLAQSIQGRGGLTHVLLCDLIYFPHLYPLLLKTLLQVTSEPFTSQPPTDPETFGPEVIISYKSRTLALEESFFQAFSLYFHISPVLSRPSGSTSPSDWKLHGEEFDTHLYVAKRWRVDQDWRIPELDMIMSPEAAKGVQRGQGGWGLIEGMFGSLEWD